MVEPLKQPPMRLGIVIKDIKISGAEDAIIKQLMQGLTRKEAAAIIGCSVRTLDTHVRALYHKLHFCKMTSLVVWAALNGYDDKGNFTPRTDAVANLKQRLKRHTYRGKKRRR